MKEYLKLQSKMLSRKMVEVGFSKVFGYSLIILGFICLSIILFSKTDYADYIYAFVSLIILSNLSKKRRNDFLKTIFPYKRYIKLRLIENQIITLPFLTFLLYQQSFVIAIVLFVVSILMSIIKFDNTYNVTIPTPFGKKPFEFSTGFRRTFYIFPLAYFVTYQSIRVNNFNLGIASMLLITIVVLSYYSKPENEYFVWSFNSSPSNFLINKIRVSFLYFTFLCLPIVVSLIIFFQSEIVIISIFLLLSYIYIITIVFAKYSTYPNEMTLQEAILIVVSLMFPPLLLGAIPIFYNKAIKQLKYFLDND